MTSVPAGDPVDEYGAGLIADGKRALAEGDEFADFSLAEAVYVWGKWVCEVERGELWVEEELESACQTRDEVDEAMKQVSPSGDRDLLVAYVDRLDQRFAAATVVAGMRLSLGGEWWWLRVPRRTDQRLFLRGDWARDT